MEANKDEARRCVLIAKRLLKEGDKPKALRFLQKAHRLHPSDEIQELINISTSSKREQNGPGVYSDRFSDHYTDSHFKASAFHHSQSQPEFQNEESENERGEEEEEPTTSSNRSTSPRRRQKTADRSRSRSAGRGRKGSTDAYRRTTSEKPQLGSDYTEDELASVNRIRHCKDYYEILGVEKSSFSETELKKQYRRLALAFHPDKCKAPGATEAFKAIGNAYAILSDPEKRKRYDTYGADHPEVSRRSSSFYEYDYSRGFEADLDPEEIFNMFFGGGFPSGRVYRRGPRHAHHYHHNETENTIGLGTLFQLVPILVLLVLSVLSQFLVGDPAYSMHRSSKYSIQRVTSELRVPYYVKEDFLRQYQGVYIRRIENQVEEDYINNLRMGCYRERNQKEALLWRARAYGDNDLWHKAQNAPTPSCDRLNQIYG